MKRALPEGRKISALVKARLQHKKAHAKDRVANGFSSYTVVSAVYNVEKYLHDFFTSMVRQTLDFENNIYLIMVDDGSTDRSAAIIKLWQKRYPNNITYLYKENGGQASARNMGLPLVKTEWVTFTDPDDFVDKNYFLEVDESLTKHKSSDIKMVCCKFVLFNETSGEIRDAHPLTYKFQKVAIKYLTSLGDYIQLHVASTFIKYNTITNQLFDINMRPAGEDALFILNYINSTSSGKAIFLPDSVYFYRKRADLTSSLDKAWDQKAKFTCVPEKYAMLIMELVKNNVALPDHVQITLLYEMTWYLAHLINHNERLYILTENELRHFKELCKYIIQNISVDNIYRFKHKPLWNFYRICMLEFFKTLRIPSRVAYIREIDSNAKTITIKAYGYAAFDILIAVNATQMTPTSSKVIKYTFASNDIVYERSCVFNFKQISVSDTIDCQSHDGELQVECNSKWFLNGKIPIRDIFDYSSQAVSDKAESYWLFMDKNTEANDNAEHLYRYIKAINPTQKLVYVLNINSPDWSRLEKDGFNLVPFKSRQHSEIYNQSNFIISSHAAEYIYAPFGKQKFSGKQFIFLQHGVTKDDMSRIFGNKTFSIFVTTTFSEFFSLASDFTKYTISHANTLLSGFPRHDHLVANGGTTPKQQILIMPTWRSYLTGKMGARGGNERHFRSGFGESRYAHAWESVLHSEKLKQFCKIYNYDLIFYAHAEMQQYIDEIVIPKHVDCLKHGEVPIQRLFLESKLMITDYSSVAFDMALIKKGIIYFQFDKDEMFSGSHYEKGYFDYERDGFGPVVETEEALLHQLEILLKNDGKPAPQYLHRMERTFPFRDGRCCERVYNAICRLQEPQRDYFSEIACLYDQAVSASRHNQRADAIELWKRFYDVSSPEVQNEMYSCLDRIPVKKCTSS